MFKKNFSVVQKYAKKIIEYFEDCLKVSFYTWSFLCPCNRAPELEKKAKKKNDCYAGYYSWTKIIGGIYEKKEKKTRLARKQDEEALSL